MLLWLSIITYMLTYILTTAKITEPIRNIRIIKEPLYCYFCTSFYVSLGITGLFPDYSIINHNIVVALLSDTLILMFFANILYWFFEIITRFAKYLESADYVMYEKIKEKPE